MKPRALLCAVTVILASALKPAAAQDNPMFTDNAIFTFLLIDRFEYQEKDGPDSLFWDAQGWVGTDYNKLWLKTDGERESGGPVEEAEVQVLYSRLVASFWDLQAGLRYDFKPNPDRTYAVFGVEGLAPYWFEVDTAAFVSEKGDVSARLEAEYELLLTQRLIVQPRIEVNLALQDVEALGIGSGFNDIELGLRLRYEIVREFAPYVGVSWERKLGETADFARDEGEQIDTFAVVAGVRVWF